jgi:hypothetical protein
MQLAEDCLLRWSTSSSLQHRRKKLLHYATQIMRVRYSRRHPTWREAKCSIVVSKLDCLSRDVAFVSGLMAQRAPFMVRSWVGMPTRSCCICTPFWPRKSAGSLVSGRGRHFRPRRLQGSLGNRTNLGSAGSAGRAAQCKAADEFARSVLPIVDAARKGGALTLADITDALNVRGVRSATGGVWRRSAVRNLLARTRCFER